MIIRLGRLTPGYFRLLQVCESSPQSANKHLSSAEEAQRRKSYSVSGCLHPFVFHLNPFRGGSGSFCDPQSALTTSVIRGDTNRCNIMYSLVHCSSCCHHNAHISNDPPYVSTIVLSLCSHIYTNLRTWAAPSAFHRLKRLSRARKATDCCIRFDTLVRLFFFLFVNAAQLLDRGRSVVEDYFF